MTIKRYDILIVSFVLFHNYLPESISIAWKSSKESNSCRLLSVQKNRWQQMLHFNGQQVPISLTKNVITLADCITKHLTSFTHSQHQIQCPDTAEHRFKQHHCINIDVWLMDSYTHTCLIDSFCVFHFINEYVNCITWIKSTWIISMAMQTVPVQPKNSRTNVIWNVFEKSAINLL